MTRCTGWVRRPDWTSEDCAAAYVLDDGRHIERMSGSLADPGKQCPQAREMTAEEAHHLWATVYVPGPEYQARRAYYEAATRGYVRVRTGGAL
jgi:hypothetical protein